MIKYFKMKKKEIELKTLLYSYALNFVKEKEDILKVFVNLVTALKDVPPEELQEKLIEQIVSNMERSKE
ncbi:hypothetical protein [Kineothrix sedimenti]|uniref:Tranposon-transfer assisting protein n=1 Tax=Kineothrix sedimenti TaxID=3123317 RepID=A0ABZ3ERG9_9FIRM